MPGIMSLPDSLREQILEAASAISPENAENAPAKLDPTQQVMVEIARQNPELFALLVIASSGYSGIEVVDTEDNVVDQVVETYDGFHTFRNVAPMKNRRVVSRQIRLLSDRPSRPARKL